LNLTRLRRLLLCAAIVVFAASLVATIGAQPQEPAPEPRQETTEAPTETVPTAIPQTAIIARSGEADALVQRVLELATPDPAMLEIASALQAETDTLNRKRAELDRLEQRTVSERTLTDQRERWQRSEQRVLAWRAALQVRLQQLIELNDRAQHERATWMLTREALADSGLGPEVVAGAADLVSRLDDAIGRLAPRIEALTELMNRSNRRLDLVTTALGEIADLHERLRERVWSRDSSPLWRTPISDLGTVTEEVSFAIEYWWLTATDWFGAHYSQVVMLAVVFAILLTCTMALRRLRPQWEGKPDLEGAFFVVSRPAATAGLASLGAAFFLLDPITGPVSDLFRLVALLTVVRLADGLSAPLTRSTYRGLAALYLVQTFAGFVPDGAIIGRLLSIGIAVGGVAAGLRALRTWPVGHGWVWRLSRLGVIGGVGLLALGGLANFLGWVDLGRTLISGVVTSALGALAWMLLVHASAAVLALLHVGLGGVSLVSEQTRREEFGRAILLPLKIAAAYAWLTGTVRNFRLSDQVTEAVRAALASSLRIGNLELSLGGILGAVFILVVTTLVARIVRLVLAGEIFPRLDMRPGTKSTLVSLINYVIIAIGVIMAATAAGFNATQLTLVLGAMSVGIGFGLQAVVGNFVSGLILMFERPVAVGDQVEAGGFLGKITHIGIRASRVKTFDGSDVIIPNSDLVTKQVRNWTLSDGTKRINLDLAVGLDSDPRAVMEILTTAAHEHELVLAEPAPRALMLGYGDSSINFRLQVWIRVENAVAVPSELHLTLIERLRAAGVEVPAVRREKHEGSGAE